MFFHLKRLLRCSKFYLSPKIDNSKFCLWVKFISENFEFRIVDFFQVHYLKNRGSIFNILNAESSNRIHGTHGFTFEIMDFKIFTDEFRPDAKFGLNRFRT
jgi:hypothetical protein